MRFFLLPFIICAFLIASPVDSSTLFSSPLELNSADSSQLESLINSFTDVKELRAHYIQTKNMTSLSQPLCSSGDFYFYSDSILIWHQLLPYEEKITLLPSGKISIVDDLGTLTEVEHGSNRMNAILSSTLSGDFDEIDQLFETFLRTENEFWLLGLIPKRSSMKKGIESIIIKSDFNGFIKELTLNSAHGITNITFTEMR